MLDVIKTTIFSLLYSSDILHQLPNSPFAQTIMFWEPQTISYLNMIIIIYYCLIRSFYWLFWITVILTCSFTRLLTDRGFLDKDIIKATEAFKVLEEAIEVARRQAVHPACHCGKKAAEWKYAQTCNKYSVVQQDFICPATNCFTRGTSGSLIGKFTNPLNNSQN